MHDPLRVLVLEDNPDDARLVERELRKGDLNLTTKLVETGSGYAKALRDFTPDLILSDYSLPQFNGMAALRVVQQVMPSTPLIIVTGTLDEETAAECIKRGAADYVLKEHLARLVPAVKGALEKRRALEAKERAEEKLRQSEELFRGIVEAAAEGMLIVNSDARIGFANERMARLLGCGVEDVVGRPLFDFTDEPGRAFATASLARRRRGIRESFDFKFLRKDGSEFWAIVSVSPLFGPGQQYRGSLAMVTDITERKRQEREIAEKAEELARSNAELEQYVHVTAHDLKEPLRTITSFVQLLGKRLEGRLEGETTKLMGFVVEGTQRMDAMIRGLLDYSSLYAPAAAPVSGETVFENALANLEAAIAGTEAVVTHDSLPELLADPQQLSRVFQNLIENALKFHSAAPPRIHVSAREEKDEWILEVRDNGIGFDPQYAERIFGIFQRLHRRTEYPGTGMGLAICKKLVELQGGRIWVESAPGKGSVFFFSCPKPAAPAGGTPETRAAALKKPPAVEPAAARSRQ